MRRTTLTLFLVVVIACATKPEKKLADTEAQAVSATVGLRVEVVTAYNGWHMLYPCGVRLIGAVTEFPLPANQLIEIAHTTYASAGAFTVDGLEASVDDDVALEKTLLLESPGPNKFPVRCTGKGCEKPNLIYATLKMMPAPAFDAWYDARCQEESQISVVRGEETYKASCFACHSVDGTKKIGPSLKDFACTEQETTNKGALLADDAFLLDSMLKPNKHLLKGYRPSMPKSSLSEFQLQSLILYMKSLSRFCPKAAPIASAPKAGLRFPKGVSPRSYTLPRASPATAGRLTEVSPDIGDRRAAFLAEVERSVSGKSPLAFSKSRHLQLLPIPVPSKEALDGAKLIGSADDILGFFWILAYVESLDAGIGRAARQATLSSLIEALERKRLKEARPPTTQAESALRNFHGQLARQTRRGEELPTSLDAEKRLSGTYDFILTRREDGYLITARGKGAAAGEVWTIDQDGQLKHAAGRRERLTCPNRSGAVIALIAAAHIEAARAASGRYPVSLEEAGVVEKDHYSVRYTPGPSSFEVHAIGEGDLAGDQWTIDEKFVLKHEPKCQ